MNFSFDPEFRPLLTTGERLLWTGRPKTGLALRPSDALFIPFSLVWFGFVLFWMTTAWAIGGSFALFGIPFLIVGLYMTIGRFIVDALKRNKTVYGITDSRVIIQSGMFNQSVKSLPLKTLLEITYREKKDGSGTITFGPVETGLTAWGNNNTWPGKQPAPAL